MGMSSLAEEGGSIPCRQAFNGVGGKEGHDTTLDFGKERERQLGHYFFKP